MNVSCASATCPTTYKVCQRASDTAEWSDSGSTVTAVTKPTITAPVALSAAVNTWSTIGKNTASTGDGTAMGTSQAVRFTNGAATYHAYWTTGSACLTTLDNLDGTHVALTPGSVLTSSSNTQTAAAASNVNYIFANKATYKLCMRTSNGHWIETGESLDIR